MLKTIVSGGQTGVDRAALDAAMRCGLEVSGWCPKGRQAEDGVIPDLYPLNETPGENLRTRTSWNVRDADGTLILDIPPKDARKRHGPEVLKLEGGTLLTWNLASSRYNRPLLVVNIEDEFAFLPVRRWLDDHGITTLNVAGPRESRRPGVYKAARAWMIKMLLADKAETTTIQNCALVKRCTQQWLELQPVRGLSAVRHCQECNARVYWCNSDQELAGNVRLGRCVAFSRPESAALRREETRREETLFLGMSVDYHPAGTGLKWDK